MIVEFGKAVGEFGSSSDGGWPAVEMTTLDLLWIIICYIYTPERFLLKRPFLIRSTFYLAYPAFHRQQSTHRFRNIY